MSFVPGDTVRFVLNASATSNVTHVWGRRRHSWYRIRVYGDETFFACVLAVISWRDVYDDTTFENTSRLPGSTIAYVLGVFGLTQELLGNKGLVFVEPKLDEMKRFEHSNVVIVPGANDDNDWVSYAKVEAV